MTIIEFLLARIAEDEAVARALDNAHDPLDWTEPGDPAVGLAGPVDGPSGYESVVIDPARVLAECEAKRRLVEAFAVDANTEDPSTGDMRSPESLEAAAHVVLRTLATIYASHRDFRSEWVA